MSSPRDTLIDWLRDAHASKESRVQNLERQIEHYDDYPDLVSKLREHAQRSRTQAGELEQCLKQLGADTSTIKEGASKLASMVQNWTTAMSPDEVVKHCIANESYAEFEAASFASLAAAAEHCGEADIATLCTRWHEEERRLVDWLRTYVPTITRAYLARSA